MFRKPVGRGQSLSAFPPGSRDTGPGPGPADGGKSHENPRSPRGTPAPAALRGSAGSESRLERPWQRVLPVCEERAHRRDEREGLIEQEMVVYSQRVPQKKESQLHLLPILLALAMIGLAAYYVVSAYNQNDDEEFLVE